MTPGTPSSHVFVVHGDLLNLACDAWMLPTDEHLTVSNHWIGQRGVPSKMILEDPSGFGKESCLASRVLDGSAPGDARRPIAIATAVPLEGVIAWGATKASEEALAHIRKAVHQFVQCAVSAVRDRKRSGMSQEQKNHEGEIDERILLGMPSFATDAGGGGSVRGEILSVLLSASQDAATKHHVDVALVLNDPRTYAHAQRIKHEGLRARAGADVTAEEGEARRIAKLVASGQLVPFLGAGVSMSAGAPSWNALLERLAKDAGLNRTEKSVLKKQNPLDQASILLARFTALNISFQQAVVDAVTRDRYGLAPILLANLRTEQAVTLNYDELFEQASEDCGMKRTVIPGDEAGDATGSWLLKLHGSTSKPDSIVLTRDDYLGFSATRNALSAIVKANLMTRHLLFVGFGLRDDHFHEVVHDVRRALPEKSQVRATALMLRPEPFEKDLWGDDLTFVHMGTAQTPDATAARTLEIFLDMVAMYASDNHPYLLDDSFESSLSNDERALKKTLLELANVGPGIKSLPAWGLVDTLLNDLGLSDGSTPRG